MQTNRWKLITVQADAPQDDDTTAGEKDDLESADSPFDSPDDPVDPSPESADSPNERVEGSAASPASPVSVGSPATPGSVPLVERTYSVPGISCGHCKAAIEAEVGEVDGVTLVEVDVDARSVRVLGEASDDAIVAAIDEAGYEVAMPG